MLSSKIVKFILAIVAIAYVGAVDNASAITIEIQPGELAEAIKNLKVGTIVLGTPPAGFTGLNSHVANEKATLAQEAVVKRSMLIVANRPAAVKEAMEYNIMTPTMTTLVRAALKPQLQQDIATQIQPGL